MIIIEFEWLKDYFELEERINYLKWNINKTKLELIRWVEGDLSGVRLTKESRGARVEEVLAAIEAELSFTKEQKDSLLILVEDGQGLEDCVLFKKYVEGKTLEVIAEELYFSYGHIKTIHAKLRKSLDFIGEYEINIKRYKSGIE